ncbi:TAXI family TRAP transporter solute-binding subunit, partial [Micrococcus luteus]|nr:TAXI family TRAP transporter solute-binding subunit [Micrococcus luteus]
MALKNWLIGVATSAMLVVSGSALAQKAQFVTVLTGGQSGVYYPVGVALAQHYAENIANVRATAQVTKASAENMNLLQAGRGEIGFSLADTVEDAWS